MGAKYKLYVYDSSGNRVAEITEQLSLQYTKKRNDPGLLRFNLNGFSPKIDLFEQDALIETWRCNTHPTINLDWYCDFRGLFRGAEETTEEKSIFTAICPGIMIKLADRIVAYPKGEVNRSLFESKEAETIMHTLVKYNATSSATTSDGRIRNGAITGVSVGTDLARGDILDIECSEENLLEALQKVASQTKTAFDFVKTGVNTWQWQYVTNTDVSASQVFSLERGNVQRIEYKFDRSQEKTVAVVGGKGEDDERLYRVVNGANYASSHDRELFVSDTSNDLPSLMDMAGTEALREKEVNASLRFIPRQTPASYYGKHYNLNHLVKGSRKGIDYTLVVSEVNVTWDSNGSESIDITLEDV